MFEEENPFSAIELSESSKKVNFKTLYFSIGLGIVFLLFVYLFVQFYQTTLRAKSHQTHLVTLSLVPQTSLNFQTKTQSENQKNEIKRDKSEHDDKDILVPVEAQNIQTDFQYQTAEDSFVLALKSSEIQEATTLTLQKFFFQKSFNILSQLITLTSYDFHSFQINSFSFPIKSKENEKSKIVICLMGLKNLDKIVYRANNILPAEITFGFQIINEKSKNNLILSYKNNHEIILMIPMESLSYPEEDPGTQILLTGLTSADLLDRITYHLSPVKDMIIGVTPFLGSRFVLSESDTTFLLNEIKLQNLILFESSIPLKSVLGKMAEKVKASYRCADLCIDQSLDENDILNQLKSLEKISLENGKAIGYLSANILTIDTISQWIKDLDPDKFELVSLSNLYQ